MRDGQSRTLFLSVLKKLNTPPKGFHLGDTPFRAPYFECTAFSFRDFQIYAYQLIQRVRFRLLSHVWVAFTGRFLPFKLGVLITHVIIETRVFHISCEWFSISVVISSNRELSDSLSSVWLSSPWEPTAIPPRPIHQADRVLSIVIHPCCPMASDAELTQGALVC
jgi:hypothetical protein